MGGVAERNVLLVKVQGCSKCRALVLAQLNFFQGGVYLFCSI